MFTSRAEYRLMLRQDNADLRLSRIGYEIGLLSVRNFNQFKDKSESIENEINRLHLIKHNGETMAKMLSRPEISYKELPAGNGSISEEIIQQVEIAIKYAGYVERQEADVARAKKLEDKSIPLKFDYSKVPSLRTEARQKLSKIRPETIGQAARISGVSPADISILLIWLKRGADSVVKCNPCDDAIDF
jgi:tRNA uridine 5-carboxymethylaminomethyl modification enzyme